ncbi:MAG: TetR/AcrR family transcriptional regulator [Christensenellaceae bacterium]
MERSTHTLAVKSQKWLVQALIALIQTKPYEEISISELCKEAGLDRRTFYRNFKDKTDVLLFYFSDLQEEYLLALKQMPERSFYSLALVYFEFWTSHLDFFKTAQYDQALNAALFQTLNTFMPAVYAEADGNIPRELRYNVSFVVGGFHNSMIQWITTGFHETAEEMAAIISGMFKGSISYWPMLDE